MAVEKFDRIAVVFTEVVFFQELSQLQVKEGQVPVPGPGASCGGSRSKHGQGGGVLLPG